VRDWTGLDADLSGSVLGFVGVLAGVAALVLIIACVNTASLLLHRGQTKRREVALRLALGAGPGPIVRQLLVEAVMLFALGGTGGVLLAAYGTTLLHGFLPESPIPIRLDLAVDWRVGLFAGAITLGSAIAFGAVPALGAVNTDVVAALKPAGGAPSRRRAFLRRFLVAAQLTVSLALLVTAGLFVRTLHKARSLDTGFEAARVGLARADVSILSRGETAGREFFESWLGRLPSVRSARAYCRMPSVEAELIPGRSTFSPRR
jgi:predicted lysophospholipase L1 biosynthesis ABC-type transport system permease subunit